MKYQIYSLSTREALRLVDTLDYSPLSEGYVEVGDVMLGDLRWYPNMLGFGYVEDPLYSITPLGFISRFTQSERLSIHEVSLSSPIIRDMLFLTLLASSIDTRSDSVYQSLEYLKSINILTPKRVLEIRGY